MLSKECVILLHGLARSKRSLYKIEKTLVQNGYHVINLGYPSTKNDIETLTNSTIPSALEQCHNNQKIHFVTHSLGGILVRNFLQHNQIDNLGKVVMLGPPNKGSEIVDKLGSTAIFKMINGPAGLQLGTEVSSFPNILKKPNYELGIIAGNKSLSLYSLLMSKPNDGKVTVENTKITGMTDHITLPTTHTFMMNNKMVLNQVLHFLEKGAFEK